MKPAADVVPLLESLALSEYTVRRYRTKGDARAEEGRHRSATEYHGLASQESKRSAPVREKLERLLGPDGGPGLPLAAALRLAREQSPHLEIVKDQQSFEDACFYMRHPLWAVHADRFRQARERWRGTPALEAMAPAYHPVWDSWTD